MLQLCSTLRAARRHWCVETEQGQIGVVEVAAKAWVTTDFRSGSSDARRKEGLLPDQDRVRTRRVNAMRRREDNLR